MNRLRDQMTPDQKAAWDADSKRASKRRPLTNPKRRLEDGNRSCAARWIRTGH